MIWDVFWSVNLKWIRRLSYVEENKIRNNEKENFELCKVIRNTR